MNRKRFAVIIILIIVIVVVVAVILFKGTPAKAPEVTNSITTSPTPSSSAITPTVSAGSSTSSSPPVSVVFSTTTVGVYKGSSFSFIYPVSWHIYSIGPFSMDDFGGQYYHGGIIPLPGAEIDVVTTTIGGPLQDIMTTELMSATNLTTSTITVDGTSCDRADYQDTYPGGFASQNISIYCLRGESLWKIYFSNRSGDPTRETELLNLNTILGSMKFLP